MAAYWLSFRLDANQTYTERYDALYAAINNCSSSWWVESSSFIVFESDDSIDTIATKVKRAIAPGVDLVIIGMPDFKTARLIGNVEHQDIISQLMPFIKKV